MGTIHNFPSNTENAHFDVFLKDNNDDPELPLLVYDHLCHLMDTPRHELCCISDETYAKIEGAVNGLLERAEANGVITNPYRLKERRVQRGG